MKRVLETGRLLLRDMTQQDLAELSSFLQDKAVFYAFEHEFSQTEAQEWLDRQIRRYQSLGFGLWAVQLKETGEFIGQAGLSLQNGGDDEEVLGVSVLIKHAHWHQGYLEECLSACLRYAFRRLRAPRLCAVVRTEDVATQKAMKALGMKKTKAFQASCFDTMGDWFLYELKNSSTFSV